MSQKNLESHPRRQSRYAISLVTFNGERDIPSCLASVASQSVRPHEFVIYDNHSRDASLQLIRQHAPTARVITSDTNNGFAHSHNEIIGATESEYILILNQDVVLDEEYCSVLVQFLDSHDDVASVTGKILRVMSLETLSNASTIDACGISLSQSQHATLTDTGKSFDACNEIHEVFGVPATCAMYRRSALEDCVVDILHKREYFDEDFFMYKEDVDLAYRLRLRGWKSFCVPQAKARHIRTAKSEYLVLNRGGKLVKFWSYRNHWYLLIKNLPTTLFWRCGLYIVFYECAKLSYTFIFEHNSLRALSDVKQNYSRMLIKRKAIQSRMTCTSADLLKWMKRIFI